MGEISWLSSFKTVGGYQIWTCGFMWFQVGEQFLDAGVDIVMFGIERWGLGPLWVVRKGARRYVTLE